jgi:hypothetical protein
VPVATLPAGSITSSARGIVVGYQTLLVERTGNVATITLNRPEARNAIDLTMRTELVAALDEVEADEAPDAGDGGRLRGRRRHEPRAVL